jgi:hypothetical protein
MAKIKIDSTKILLEIDKNIVFEDAAQLRGFFGNLYKNRPEFHGHINDKLVYKHPLIQYKHFSGKFSILGLQEGAYLLKSLKNPEIIELWYKKYKVKSWKINSTPESFGLSQSIHTYEFLTPWLGLNQDNYLKYIRIRNNKEEVSKFLKKIIIGNLLSLSKSVKYTATEEIIVNPDLIETEPVKVKNGQALLLTFMGKFSTNFFIPVGWGIGKFSSRGYGVVIPMDGGIDSE